MHDLPAMHELQQCTQGPVALPDSLQDCSGRLQQCTCDNKANTCCVQLRCRLAAACYNNIALFLQQESHLHDTISILQVVQCKELILSQAGDQPTAKPTPLLAPITTASLLLAFDMS